jgi:integrase
MRPRTDGSPTRAPNKRQLTELYVRKLKPQAVPFNVWDEHERGLVLRMQPSGQWSFKFVYPYRGRPRWYHLGKIHLADARRLVQQLRVQVTEGKDPQAVRLADKRARRNAGSFAELAQNYLELHAKRHNKSWKQADALVCRHLLPQWGKLEAKSITRSDVRLTIGRIAAPMLANQVLASASAIFSWAVKQEVVALNPCHGIDRHKTTSRERVLKDHELPRFWNAFDQCGRAGVALKLILLTGQRPGEVSHLRAEHIHDGWWEMPGEPVPALDWPGTKNSQNHRSRCGERARRPTSTVEEHPSPA